MTTRLATVSALALLVITAARGATAEFSPAIYSIRPDGSDRTLVWSLDPPVYGTARSRDGRMIAFTRGLGWYVTDISGKEPVRVQAGGYPVFSPDGTRLAMSSSTEISVVNSDGIGLHRVTEHGGAPSWSPDGRRLVFLASPADRIKIWASKVQVVSAEGGRVRTIARGLNPQWAPRGHRIAYLGLRRGYAVPCFVNPDGSRRTCYRGFSVNGGFVWSPDGKRIAFRQSSPSRLTVVTADGQHIRRFPTLSARTVVRAWSPDSRWLAYTKEENWGPYTSYQLYIRPVDRRGPERAVIAESHPFEAVRWNLGRISYLLSE